MDLAALIPTKQYRTTLSVSQRKKLQFTMRCFLVCSIIQKRLYATGAQYLKFRRFITF